jgi:hypothetical protein
MKNTTNTKDTTNTKRQLSRPARRGFVIAHVVASVGWLGLTLCLLVLSIAGATANGTGTGTGAATPAAEAAYRAMKIFGDWLLAPLALATIATGLVLSLGTPWGLARHRWVFAKFWITLGAAIASMLSFRTGINDAAAEVSAGQPVSDPSGLLFPPGVSLALYLFVTVISYLKPWGLTRRGRRHRERRTRSRARSRTRTRNVKPLAAATPRQPV